MSLQMPRKKRSIRDQWASVNRLKQRREGGLNLTLLDDVAVHEGIVVAEVVAAANGGKTVASQVRTEEEDLQVVDSIW